MSHAEDFSHALTQTEARAQKLIAAGRTLLKLIQSGKTIDARAMRETMEQAFGASDASGAWIWKDAYEVAECAQVMFLQQFGSAMQRQPPPNVHVSRFYTELFLGRVKACSLQSFQEMTVLELCDQDGSLRENMPPISRFLNRCLALTIDMQNAIFDCFMGILEEIVSEAIASGSYDVGLETLRAERFTILDRKMIYEHGNGSAATTALTIERVTRNQPLSLDDVRAICTEASGTRLLVNDKSGRAAVARPTNSLMTDEGVPIARAALLRPMSEERILELELAVSEWKEVSDAAFSAAWTKEVDRIPEFSTDKITLVSGLLLPIWDRLPQDNMRVYRCQAENGEKVIGRLVTQDQLGGVYRSLGLDCDVELSADETLSVVMVRGGTVELAQGLSLRRSRVMDANRLEFVGFVPSDLQRFKAIGCFTEIIQWKTRLFVPADDATILQKLLDEVKSAPAREAA